MAELKFSIGNGKLGKDTLIFSLPAGWTCPGADVCLSRVVERDGHRMIQDGPNTVFRCFAASSEVVYPKVYDARMHNWNAIREQLNNFSALVDMINRGIQDNAKRNTRKVRIHESGDFFSGIYLDAWVDVARKNPDLLFYCYSKNLPLFLQSNLSANFYMTASKGGRWDSYIEAGAFQRYSVVVKDDAEADALGLEVDHDDSHCFGQNPFALLVHGIQPKGSEWGKAIRKRRKEGKHSGYGKK
jgi:hypothetical protein